MKALVDKSTGTIVGSYAQPLDFSISGKIVIDIPDSFGIAPSTNVVSALIADKVAAFEDLHPSLTESHYDELFTTAMIDATLSSRVIIGPDKRSAIMPAGWLMTNPIAIAGPGVKTTVCVHWSGHTTCLEYQSAAKSPPNRVLLDYDPGLPGFSNFDPMNFGTYLMDSTGAVTLAGPFTVDYETTVAPLVTPLSVRLKFVNVGTRTAHLSDWILMV